MGRKQMERLYEARIAELKEAHELRHKESLRVIKALADEVEYLRAKHFGPALTQPASTARIPVSPERDFMPDPERSPFYIPEELEDLEALRAGGHLDASDYETARRQLIAATGGVPLQIEQID